MKNMANVITFSRFVFALLMVLAVPFSAVFWGCYLCGGISDMLDGFIARRLNQQSSDGAKLDSIADLFFALSIFIVILRNIHFPKWLWFCVALIALLRIISFSIGFYKYHAFSSLHTYLNKTAGTSLFVCPLLIALIGINAAGGILCFIALVSSIEEMIIMIKSNSLNRDCKSIFMH